MWSLQGTKCKNKNICKNRMQFVILCVLNCVTFLCPQVQGGTLARPLSPVKVLAAAGIDEPGDKTRYYTFSEEDIRERNRNRNLVGSNQPSHSPHQTNGYASRDPFEVPSLTVIAEMMRKGETGLGSREEDFRRRESYGERDHPEHRGGDKSDTGWGWPRPSSQERDRDRDVDGWSQTTTWRPPRPQPPPPTVGGGWGWDKGSGREKDDGFPPPRPTHGKGSFTPIDNKDAYRPWQVVDDHDDRDRGGGGGWGPPTTERHGWGPTTTERPRYTPKYLASDEDKYKPIRYPSSVTGSGGGGGGGWSGRERPPPPPQNHGHGPVYLPPHRDREPPHHRDPPFKDPPKWPPPSSNRDRDYDRRRPPDRDGWGPRTERPPPNRGWDSDDRRPPPRPPSWPSSGGGHHGHQGHHDKGGWGWDKPPPTTRPPPTTQRWGWDRKGGSQRERPNQRPSPFEYKEGVDDLSKHLSSPIDTYPHEREEYPPGISRDRPNKYDSSSSFEHDDFPRAPNHYRIVAYTPSPEEIEQIINAKKFGGSISKTYLPPRDPENRPRPPTQSRNQGQSQDWLSDNDHISEIDKGVQDKEKWYQKTFKNLNSPNPHPPPSKLPQPPSKTTTSTKSDPESSSNSKPKQSPLPAPDVLSLDPEGESQTGNANGKPAPNKRTRYDAQGFKYIPFDHPASKKLPTAPPPPPRDIYSHLELREGRGDPQNKSGKTENPKEKVLQGSESRNSFVRRSFNSSRSHISLWKSDQIRSDQARSDQVRSTTATTTTSTTPTPHPVDLEVTTSRSPRLTLPTPRPSLRRGPGFPPFKRFGVTPTPTLSPGENPGESEKPSEVHDFGRKINIIRNRLKKVEGGGFKPVSGPFGTSSSFRGRGREPEKEREPLLEGPTSLILYPGTNITRVININFTTDSPMVVKVMEEENEKEKVVLEEEVSPTTFTPCSSGDSIICPDLDDNTIPSIISSTSPEDDTPTLANIPGKASSNNSSILLNHINSSSVSKL